MALPRPSTMGSRLAYHDNPFRDIPSVPRSLHSSTSSISTNSTASCHSLHAAYNASRPLSPAPEEWTEEFLSVKCKKSPRRFRFGTIFNRRTYPQATEDLEPQRPSTEHRVQAPRFGSLPPPPSLLSTFEPSSRDSSRELRRISLPKLRTAFPPPQCAASYANKPLPAVPSGPLPQQSDPSPPREGSLWPAPLKISKYTDVEGGPQRCYYHFGPRNCPGYIIGGGPGDPCENCLAAGFFGAA